MTIGIGIGIPQTNIPWTPFAVGNPIVMLDAAMGITLNGADVSNWADQSGNGNDASQGTAADQPLFNASDADFNNQPSVEGDGVSEFLDSANFTQGDQTQPNTIFVVYKFGDNVSFQTLYDGVTGGRHIVSLSSTQALMLAVTPQNIHTEDTSSHILACLFNGASSDSWRDGTQTTPAGDVGALTMRGLTLFANSGGGSQWANLKIAYLVGYNADLSDTAKNYIGNGLAARFGTTWTDI